TGIEVQDGARTSIKTGLFYSSGSNTNGSQFRMDHCKLNNLNGYPIFDTVVGVLDHNSFVVERQQDTMFIYGARWNNQNYGDGSWAALSGYGSSQFLFIEDNDFVNNTASLHPMTAACDGADATNVWDVNDPNAFFTGTAASNSSGTTVTVSGSPNWTTNQWVGYALRRTSNICGSNSLSFGEIRGNTSNTITYTDSF